MSHARVEEVSDSDSDSDPDDMDPADFNPSHIISPANIPSSSSTSANATSTPITTSHGGAPPPTRPQAAPVPAPVPAPDQRDVPRNFHCLYPVYFDQTRTRAEGRKVSRKLAVANPLAREIVDAVQVLGLRAGFEGDKIHPKDWANPGRVRVGMRRENGSMINDEIKNKHHLYILVAKYLKAHPTTEDTPFRLHIRGLPMPEKLPPAPPAPRGWKIGTILPIHSPAVSGGGVSDNPFKEAMAEMQQAGMGGDGPGAGAGTATGTGNGGGGGGGGGEGKKKKDKKKGKQ